MTILIRNKSFEPLYDVVSEIVGKFTFNCVMHYFANPIPTIIYLVQDSVINCIVPLCVIKIPCNIW